MPSSGIVFYRAITPLHPGSGESVGTIDNAVQREAHTGWPTCGTKGPNRSLYRAYLVANRQATTLAEADEHPKTKAIFGSAGAGANETDGAMAFSDARIFAFPVRTTLGLFALATCPAVLNDFATKACVLAGVEPPFRDRYGASISDVDAVFLGGESKFVQQYLGQKRAFVEDVMLSPKSTCDSDDKVKEWLSRNQVLDEGLLDRLTVVSDDVFRYFTERCTVLMERNRLDPQTKRVMDKALFKEEYLPPETILYAFVRTVGKADEVYQDWKRMFAKFGGLIHIGGDESTGKGWCRAQIVDAKGGPT